MTDEHFEQLKTDFLEKNKRFTHAVDTADKEYYRSAYGRFAIAELHHTGALSYTTLLKYAKGERLGASDFDSNTEPD